ncbi:helix-turn-helix domain-containing protein, partial [Burkholderia sp. AW49-1]
DVADGKLQPWRAAERLGLTTRQIRRLVGRSREHGPQGLVSQRRAKPSNNRLGSMTADRVLSIIRDRYADFGPTLACEKLSECHDIRLAKETVRKLETGQVNVILWAGLLEKFRKEALGAALLAVYGVWQAEGKVRHVIANKLMDRTELLGALPTTARNFC